MHLTRRAALAAAALVPAGAARAQAWPSRPIRWIVGYPPGGGTDVLARLVGAAMSARLGQPVVVENRPGAATNLAAQAAATAEPDGHTVFTAGNETLVFNPVLYRSLGYEPDRDLRLLGLMARFHLVLAVRPSSEARSGADLLARVRANPGRVDFGTPGVGSPHHVAMERLASDLGLRFNHVPYRGMAPVMNDLMAGTVEAAVVDMAAGGPLLREGRIRPLAVLSPAPIGPLPGVPIADQALGTRGFSAFAWQGLTAPARTPDAVAARLSATLAEAVADPAVQARMGEIGLEPLPGGPAEHRAMLDAERAVVWPVLRALDLRLD
ncbi:MAG TPA: tripartite tricarboxylate transporter substrate binding protein [Acetobacteraceae bacterium]|nr:tripartite tricarboxylate transporter substrate binding protein [Acetobacteraceae bacterium]